MPEDPRLIAPFRTGELLTVSRMNALRLGVSGRIKGLPGRTSSSHTSTGHGDQALREPVFVLNKTGQTLEPYSVFSVRRSPSVGDPDTEDAVDYFHETVPQSEGMLTAHGLMYVTNGAFGLANGATAPCFIVGDEPVIARFDDALGVPLVGHPIGPNEEGEMIITRCGYIVISEPDFAVLTENKVVWVVKSNDHTLYVKALSAVIADGRGSFQIENPEGAPAKDPDTGAPTFTIRQIKNLTGNSLIVDSLYAATPTLGLGYVIFPSGEVPPPATRECRWVFIEDNFLPGDINKPAAFANYNSGTNEWDNSAVYDQFVHDEDRMACIAPGEMSFVCPRPVDATHNPQGTHWDIISEQGLKRRVRIQATIDCGQQGLGSVLLGELNCFGDVLTPELELLICNSGQGYTRTLWGPQTDPQNPDKPAERDLIWVEYDRYNWYPVRDTSSRIAFAVSGEAFCRDAAVDIQSPGIVYADYQYSGVDGNCEVANINIEVISNSKASTAGDVTDALILVWDEQAQAAAANLETAWQLVQVNHALVSYIVDVFEQSPVPPGNPSNCDDILKQPGFIAAATSADCGIPSPESIMTFTRESYLTEIKWNENICQLTETEKSACFYRPLDETENVITQGEPIDVVVEVFKYTVVSGGAVLLCAIIVERKSFCTISYVTEGRESTIRFFPRTTVEDVRDETDGLYIDPAQHFILCNNILPEEKVVDYTDCDGQGGTEEI